MFEVANCDLKESFWARHKGGRIGLDCSERELDFLQPLHVVHAWNLTDAVDDSLEMFQVGDFEDDIDVGLTVGATG
jgi:hypothetical protein